MELKTDEWLVDIRTFDDKDHGTTKMEFMTSKSYFLSTGTHTDNYKTTAYSLSKDSQFIGLFGMYGMMKEKKTLLKVAALELNLECVKNGWPKPTPPPEPPAKLPPIIKTEIITKWKEPKPSNVPLYTMITCAVLSLIILVCLCCYCKASHDKKRELAVVMAAIPPPIISEEAKT